jgi:sporulation protein YlmC with PRC-barrel domain
MRARDLIGQPVTTTGATALGIVSDIRCTLDGPLRGALCLPRVSHLVVSARHTGSLLGYDRREQQGPWLIRVIVRRLHRNITIVPWSAVRSYADTVVVDMSADQERA